MLHYKRVHNFHRKIIMKETFRFKGALSALKQILADESSLKVMKNALYFT